MNAEDAPRRNDHPRNQWRRRRRLPHRTGRDPNRANGLNATRRPPVQTLTWSGRPVRTCSNPVKRRSGDLMAPLTNSAGGPNSVNNIYDNTIDKIYLDEQCVWRKRQRFLSFCFSVDKIIGSINYKNKFHQWCIIVNRPTKIYFTLYP